MLADADLAAVAELMSGKRATLLLALLGGVALSAGELAKRADISPALASSHLARLLDGGLVVVEAHGRHRHYRLAGVEVAAAIEAALAIAPVRQAKSLRDSRQGYGIRFARTCYDHLAGAVGIALLDGLEHRGVIAAAGDSWKLTADGEHRFEELGIDVEALRAGKRTFVRPCLDWTERRDHLAGALGAGITDRLFELGWIKRVPGGRTLRVSEAGETALREEFGLNVAGIRRAVAAESG